MSKKNAGKPEPIDAVLGAVRAAIEEAETLGGDISRGGVDTESYNEIDSLIDSLKRSMEKTAPLSTERVFKEWQIATIESATLENYAALMGIEDIKVNEGLDRGASFVDIIKALAVNRAMLLKMISKVKPGHSGLDD